MIHLFTIFLAAFFNNNMCFMESLTHAAAVAEQSIHSASSLCVCVCVCVCVSVCESRQEFCSEACPDLTKEVYLQDIHCVGSLCKLYFRELPNPLLTYELYSKFTEAVLVQGDHERLLHIQKVIKELPVPHFRTLEYLTKHLAYLATFSSQTNMHTRNLALVWAPNLLRSKDIETSSGNGDMAFQEVRIQQSVVEFILNHTEQIFNGDVAQVKPKEGVNTTCGEKYATLPLSAQSVPMKLMSLEEAQARSLSPNHPVHRERQRENSLPNTSTATLYHTVIDISDSKRKLSGKSKKWKSIFNLGKSVDSKGKLSRNGSVFIRAQGTAEKASLRPSRSMESLCSLPTDDDRTVNKGPSSGCSSIFTPDVKSRTLGSDSLFDLGEHEQNWEIKSIKPGGATCAWSSGINQTGAPGDSAPPRKSLPEQLKVFKGDDDGGYKPTSPKNRRMLYSGSSHNSSSRPSFPGSFFPLESSPRHQRRAVNISEPFAVSVPLRVSAVISSNSTPCGALAKDKAATLRPPKESAEQGSTFPQTEAKKQEAAERKDGDDLTLRATLQETSKEEFHKGHRSKATSEPEPLLLPQAKESKDSAPSSGKELQSNINDTQLKWGWSACEKLQITEPEVDMLNETFKSVFTLNSFNPGSRLTMDVKSKRSRSSPSLTLLCREPPSNGAVVCSGCGSKKRQPSESDILSSLNKSSEGVSVIMSTVELEKKLDLNVLPLKKSTSLLSKEDDPVVPTFSGTENPVQTSLEPKIPHEVPKDEALRSRIAELESIQRLSVCLEEKRNTLELPKLEEDEGCGRNSEELDLVEDWEDLNSTKQWVTSPLHSPDVEQMFNHFSNLGLQGDATSSLDVKRQNSSESVAKAEPQWIHQASGKIGSTKASSQRFHRQMSHETAITEREESSVSKHRPFSLNLDTSHRCIRDISNQQSRRREKTACPEAGNNGLHSDLELFLSDCQAPLRRNSAPVSVASVRTAFMIKTCQAKAVPVVPPKVQYSQIPHLTAKEPETERPKMIAEKSNSASPPSVSKLKEELENKEPKHQKHLSPEKLKSNTTSDVPVVTRRHAPSLEVFVDCPRANRTNVLQRPSFRNRQRPQSLILFSPPFPIMDYPTSNDDGKFLSSIKGLDDSTTGNVFSRETVEGVALQNKMTIPKSGQRLETSTSCFYQPQRRSMIFDSRSQRQIE
uniref:Rho-GAP domain-containing protein n=1 Tax=Gouania willdenowi TaxID=441366 RepID=A0A8C5E9P3_GOUWI